LQSFLLIPDSNGCVNWIIVGSDVLVIESVNLLSDVVVAPVVELSLLHLETIRVGEEGTLVVEAMGVEVSHHLMAVQVRGGQGVKVDIQLHGAELVVKADMDYSLSLLSFLLVWLLKVQRELLEQITLGNCSTLELTVREGIEQPVHWSEQVSTRVGTTVFVVDVRRPPPQPEVERLCRAEGVVGQVKVHIAVFNIRSTELETELSCLDEVLIFKHNIFSLDLEISSSTYCQLQEFDIYCASFNVHLAALHSSLVGSLVCMAMHLSLERNEKCAQSPYLEVTMGHKNFNNLFR
jgi:hypothetical protein